MKLTSIKFDRTPKQGGKMGKFEIFIGADDQYYFRLKAENGLTIAASQGYTTKQSAQNGIEAIQRVAASAEVEDLTEETVHAGSTNS